MSDDHTAITAKLEAWQGAYQAIRRVDNWLLAGITPAQAEQAISDAWELAGMLHELADQVERQAEHAAEIADQAEH